MHQFFSKITLLCWLFISTLNFSMELATPVYSTQKMEHNNRNALIALHTGDTASSEHLLRAGLAGPITFCYLVRTKTVETAHGIKLKLPNPRTCHPDLEWYNKASCSLSPESRQLLLPCISNDTDKIRSLLCQEEFSIDKVDPETLKDCLYVAIDHNAYNSQKIVCSLSLLFTHPYIKENIICGDFTEYIHFARSKTDERNTGDTNFSVKKLLAIEKLYNTPSSPDNQNAAPLNIDADSLTPADTISDKELADLMKYARGLHSFGRNRQSSPSAATSHGNLLSQAGQAAGTIAMLPAYIAIKTTGAVYGWFTGSSS